MTTHPNRGKVNTMKRSNKTLWVVLLGSLSAFTSAASYAAVASLPLFVSLFATPNVMLLFDNSGSMNNIIWDAGFVATSSPPDWSTTWDPDDGNVTLSELEECSGGNVGQSGTSDCCPDNYKRGKKSTGGKRCLRLPDPVGSETTRYYGKYLNYLFETYGTGGGADIRTTIPATTRIATARNVATNFVNSNSNLRIGLASFNPNSGAPSGSSNNQGGRINAVCGTATSTLVTTIAGYGAVANTPLSESYYEVTRYFRGINGHFNTGAAPYASPIQYRCQRNFGIVLTDGAPTFDRSIPNNDPDDPTGAPSLPNWDGLSPAPPAQFSDGDNTSGDAEGDTYYLDDVAKFAYETDARKTGNDLYGGSYNDAAFEIQRLRTYTIGFAVNNQMLQDAAFYGDGAYYTADNDAQLTAALKSVVSDIQTRTSSAASVATNSTRLSTDTLIYQARFSTNDWGGQLLAFPVTSSGGIGTVAWDAKNLIPAHASRNIVTFKPGTGGINFVWDTAVLTTAQQRALRCKPTENINTCITTGTNTDAYGSEVLSYLRGNDVDEAPADKDFRPRTSLLGDIVNSDPVFVGKQDYGFEALGGSEGTAYATFRATSAYQTRTPMLYVGANDGMLHGFNATAGNETFAYVPNAVYPKLRFLTEASKSDDPLNVGLPASGYNQKHQYILDGSSRTIDAYISYDGGATTNWETVLVGSLGAGGAGIFGLKVTAPASLGTGTPKWEFTTASTGGSELGFSIPQPSMGRMNDGSWVAIIGNGYESASNTARLYLLNLATGAVIKEFNTGVGSASQPNGLSSPIPIDVNRDRKIDYIYAGDLHGNMWKFDVSGSTVASWDFGIKSGTTPVPLFTACTTTTDATTCYNSRQSITARPDVTLNPTGGQMVLFGTGKYFDDCDNKTVTNGATVNCSADAATATQTTQSFYGLRDTFAAGATAGIGRRAISASGLLQQTVSSTETFTGTGISEQTRTTTNTAITDAHKGWVLDLPTNGERQVATPILRGGRIIFTTLIPSQDPCGFGGDSWLMELDALSGSRLAFTPFDLNQDGEYTATDFVVPGVGGGSTGGSGTRIPASGRKSKQGIIKTPGIIQAGETEYKYASGTTGGIDITRENAGTSSGRQSWRQIR